MRVALARHCCEAVAVELDAGFYSWVQQVQDTLHEAVTAAIRLKLRQAKEVARNEAHNQRIREEERTRRRSDLATARALLNTLATAAAMPTSSQGQ